MAALVLVLFPLKATYLSQSCLRQLGNFRWNISSRSPALRCVFLYRQAILSVVALMSSIGVNQGLVFVFVLGYWTLVYDTKLLALF